MKTKIYPLLFLLSLSFILVTAEEYRVVLEPKFHTTLSSEVTTTVEVISKRMGERFNKGDVLMRLSDAVYRSNRAKALAALERGKAELNAQQRLYKDKAASTLDLREAEAKEALAAADLALADKEFRACTLVAPYNGKVQDLKVQEYEHVQPGQALMEVLDDSVLIAKLLLPSTVALTLKLGETLTISLPEVNSSVSAVITHIAPGIDPASSLVKIDSEIKNDQDALRAGMIGILQIGNVESHP